MIATMTTFITILRGINVSGQKKIRMDELKTILEKLKFQNIRTYIQSGNIIFKDGENNPGELVKKIENAIFDNYGFQVPVIIRDYEQLLKIKGNNPFLKQKDNDITKLYVTFLAGEPQKEYAEQINTFNDPVDKFIIKGTEIYLFCPGGYGKTKLSNSFFERKLKITATTRNWKTVNKLVEIAEKRN